MSKEQGNILRFFRESNNYSQEQVAKFLDIGRQNYSHYETGRYQPPINSLVKLSRLYKIPINRLIYVEPELKEAQSSSPEELERLLSLFNMMSEENQKETIRYAKFLYEET